MFSNERNLPQTLTVSTAAKSDEHYDLPIISDCPTRCYVRSTKIMVIFQGSNLKSSSPVIVTLEKMFESTAFVINDHPTENTSGPPDRLKQKAKNAVDGGVKLIVVNSSFSNLPLNRYYAALAHHSRYITLVIPPIIKLPSGDWFLSNTYLPLFSAWYIHDVDSNTLISHARASIVEAFQFCPDFCCAMSTAGVMPCNFKDFYQFVFEGELRLCVAKIFHNKKDVKEYFEKSYVKKYYGKSAILEITAFVITPYSIYAKVKLNSQQKELFDVAEKSYDMLNYPSILKKQSLKSLPAVRGTYYPFLSKRTLKVKARLNDVYRKVVSPDSGNFSHSHINLGYIQKTPVHRRNIDATLGAEMENKGLNSELDFQMYELDNFYVKRIEDFWFIYLKHLLTVDSLFTTCCKLQ